MSPFSADLASLAVRSAAVPRWRRRSPGVKATLDNERSAGLAVRPNGGGGLHKSELMLQLLFVGRSQPRPMPQDGRLLRRTRQLFFWHALFSVSACQTLSGYNYTPICETLDRTPSNNAVDSAQLSMTSFIDAETVTKF